jgi:hypothetical protein
LNELINRKLVMVQKDRDTGKISGYFIWEQNIEEVEEKPCIE